MAKKNLISLAEIPIGEMIPDEGYEIGYRSSFIYNGQEGEYFLSTPFDNRGRRIDINIVGYVKRVSRDDEENGHEKISKEDEEEIKKLIRPKVRRLDVSKHKRLQFNFYE